MPELRLGLTYGYSRGTMTIDRDLILEAERLGFYSVWTAEAYGSDAVSPLAYIGDRDGGHDDRYAFGRPIHPRPAICVSAPTHFVDGLSAAETWPRAAPDANNSKQSVNEPRMKPCAFFSSSPR